MSRRPDLTGRLAHEAARRRSSTIRRVDVLDEDLAELDDRVDQLTRWCSAVHRKLTNQGVA